MKKYFEYMDNRKVSDTLHQRLLNLEVPEKRPAAWKKYGATAAALALVVGIGAWGLSRGDWNAAAQADANAEPSIPEVDAPENGDIGQPDIAPEEPGGTADPGPNILGGFEVPGPENGEMSTTAFYAVPGIEYGMTKDVAQMELDWDLPAGCVRRDLTQADIAALFRQEQNLSFFLGWTGYTLTGWAAWYADGSLWGAYINGYKDAMERFEFAFMAGDTYPPTCIGYGNGKVNELWWGTPVTAYGFDGEHGCDRRVEFMKGGYGFRFDNSGPDQDRVTWLSALLVRYLCDYDPFGPDGSFVPESLSPEGAVLAHPWEDPNYVEPDNEDSPDEVFPDETAPG